MPPANYAIRLRRPYDSLKQSISAWSLECSKVVAYEHPEDGNIHCHLAIMGYYGSKQHLKDVLNAHGQVFTPAQWSFNTTFKAPGSKTCIDITDETLPGYITYMSKGKYEPKYLKGVSDALCEEQKTKWIDHKKRSEVWVKSADRVMLDEFEEYLWRYQDTTGEALVAQRKIKEIRGLAFTWSVAKHQGCVSMPARKLAKMLVDSYTLAYKLVTVDDLILPFEPIK